MREIYYAIYKNSFSRSLFYTRLTELVLHERCSFVDNKLQLPFTSKLSNEEIAVFDKVYINGVCTFNEDTLNEWRQYLIENCYDLRFVTKKTLFKGFKKTREFKKHIKREKIHYHPALIKYIETKDLYHLDAIDPKIKNVEFPTFRIYSCSGNCSTNLPGASA